jgi:hypothetical protein
LAGAFLCAAGTRHPERQRSLRISLVTLEIKKDIHNKKTDRRRPRERGPPVCFLLAANAFVRPPKARGKKSPEQF